MVASTSITLYPELHHAVLRETTAPAVSTATLAQSTTDMVICIHMRMVRRVSVVMSGIHSHTVPVTAEDTHHCIRGQTSATAGMGTDGLAGGDPLTGALSSSNLQ